MENQKKKIFLRRKEREIHSQCIPSVIGKARAAGITLVALVVTIVVLLILAGITIMYIMGDNSIFKLAQDAKTNTEQAKEAEKGYLENLGNTVNQYLNGGGTTNPPDEPDTPTIPEGLEVGDTVAYSSRGTYHWLHKYCSSTKAETAGDGTDAFDLLESGIGKDFNISEWKVLSIDEGAGKVELVPSSPTTGTVYLGEAQGYNNGVKLLNDACSNLYGNASKGITAKSINIGDIEKYMTNEAKTGTNGAHNFINTDSNAKYGNKVASPYETYKNYPVIYAQEIKAVIGTEPEKTTGLGLSDPGDNFIERSKGTSGATVLGSITTATKIQPYQTYWYKDNAFMQTAFKPYKGENTYYNLIIPKGNATNYWVASRCVGTASGYCSFGVRYVGSGGVSAYGMCNSNASTSNDSLALFPIITLSSELLKPGTKTEFAVQLEG